MTYRPLDTTCERCRMRPAEEGMTMPDPDGRRIRVCWLCLQQHISRQRTGRLPTEGPLDG